MVPALFLFLFQSPSLDDIVRDLGSDELETRDKAEQSLIAKGHTPGEYDIKIVYYASSKSLLAGAQKDLVTNTVRIKVVAK